jgi:hypothetical protein
MFGSLFSATKNGVFLETQGCSQFFTLTSSISTICIYLQQLGRCTYVHSNNTIVVVG